MDPIMNSPRQFPTIREHSPGIYELNRKRKLLQYELGNSGNLPRPKHKLRDRSGNLDHNKENSPEELTDCGTGDGLEVEYEHDSSNIFGGSDNKITFEVDSNTEGLSNKPLRQEQPLTSFNSSTSSLSNDNFYYVESRSMKEGSNDRCDKKYGNNDAEIEDETTKEDMNLYDEEIEDETTKEDMMLYSNDVAPFLLSSGRWNLGQDARLGTRKPTIDQEFEQYFSALML